MLLERDIETAGKVSFPKSDSFFFLVKAFLQDRSELDDINLVPVSLSYEKVLEYEAFPIK